MSGAMRRAQRLRQRREFAAVYRRGRQYRGDLLVVRALRSGLEQSRFGFTASLAVGKAVVRNRVKRRLREAVRSLVVGTGWDVVISARKGSGDANYQRLRGQLSELMMKAGALDSVKEEPGR